MLKSIKWFGIACGLAFSLVAHGAMTKPAPGPESFGVFAAEAQVVDPALQPSILLAKKEKVPFCEDPKNANKKECTGEYCEKHPDRKECMPTNYCDANPGKKECQPGYCNNPKNYKKKFCRPSGA